MFGIDFSELVVCILVALVVIGPERMPEAVRTVGLWIGRIKRSLRDTREQVERQLGIEGVRRQLHTEEMMRTLDDMNEEIETALHYERMASREKAEKNAKLLTNTTDVNKPGLEMIKPEATPQPNTVPPSIPSEANPQQLQASLKNI